MRFNLLTVSALLAFAACDDKADSGDGTDAGGDADTDADTDTDTETGGETGPTGPSGPWDVFYFSYYYETGVDSSGNLAPINTADGTTINPTFYISFASEDFFNGADEEVCDVVLDMSGAQLDPTPLGSNYASWTFDATTATMTDGCAGVSGDFYGYPPSALWGSLIYTIAIGPYNSAVWDNYFPATYSDVYVGGQLSDGLFIDADSNYVLWDVIGQGFAEDGAGGYDYYSPLSPAEVPAATGGVTPGFYYGLTLFIPLY